MCLQYIQYSILYNITGPHTTLSLSCVQGVEVVREREREKATNDSSFLLLTATAMGK